MIKIRSIVFALILVSSAAQANSNVAGFVAALKGDARIMSGQDTVAASIGQNVFVGDVLVTGKKGRLKVLLTDDAIISLGSNSRLRLVQHLFEPATHKRVTRLDLVRGLVRSLVKHVVAGSVADFQVKHSNAVAGVRGTEFAMYTTDEGARLATLSGTVAWAQAGQEPVLVRAGQGSSVSDHGTSLPVALAAADLKTLRSATDVVQSPSALAMNIMPEKTSSSKTPSIKDGMNQDSAAPAQSSKELPDSLNGGFSGSDKERNDWQNIGGAGPSASSSFTGPGPMTDSGNGLEGIEGEWSSGFYDGSPACTCDIDVSLRIVLERK